MTALVGSIVNSGLLTGTGNTATITTGSTTAGNSIPVWGWHEGGTTAYTSITVTDGGNTWTNSSNQRTSTNRSAMAACAFSIASGGVRTITITFNGGTGNVFGEYFAGEFSGGLSAFDQAGGSTGFGAAPVTATNGGANAGTDDLAIAALSVGDGGTETYTDPPTGGATWTTAGTNLNDSTNAGGMAVYRIDTSAVTDAVTWSAGWGAPSTGSAVALWSIKTTAVSTPTGPLMAQACL
jgi:hypothetical protein